ncbi:serine protease [[Phormidium ambiguum] IAM M-71]|uniref:Serine protease n=1 Tax=[Phormidium ambiguum] IAM M-71 TaxID=454136 RepID=A0A1U7IP15_9CYAN|nr:CAP domain-containing protein [Phormidium ambiguum]OKH39023.1 serine protease [Phormidium ambiguum IAM M-71]
MFRKVSKIAFGSLFLVVGLSGCVVSEINSFMQPEIPLSNSEIVAQNQNSLSNLERSIHEQVNKYRQSQNLPPLQLNAAITQQSRLHSQAMASGKVPFSHQGFEQRVNAIEKSVSYRSAGENVAYNQGYKDPATQAVQGWLKSPGHLKNIRGNFNLTGIGVAQNSKGEYYFTQIFIRSR